MCREETYKARLILAATKPGIFNWESDTRVWRLPTGDNAVLNARHVDSLAEATEFHIDVGGFPNPDAARSVGEQVRGTLQLTNAILGLGLNVPSVDQEVERAKLSPHLKEKFAKEHGAVFVDCVFGLNVLKEGDEFELAVKGTAHSKPSDSGFILEMGTQLWGANARLDRVSRLACELVNTSLRDHSPRSAFLVSFLALDLLLERSKRSDDANAILDQVVDMVKKSALDDAEKSRLSSFLGSARYTSLSAEIDRFVSLGSNQDITVNEEPLGTFLQNCLKLRHKLAHPPKGPDSLPNDDKDIDARRRGLHQVVMNIIWARNKLPDSSVYRPADVVSMSEMKISVV